MAKKREVILPRRFEITHTYSADRFLLIVMFWLWGLGGGVTLTLMVVYANNMESLGVGTSAAITMNAVYWLGGLVLFGVGALLANTRSTMRIHDPVPPPED